MKVLQEKSIVVTGAGRGLGRVCALEAVRQGASVVVNDIDEDVCAAVLREIKAAGGNAVSCVGSVANWDDAGAIVQTSLDAFGRLDGLLNNAGIVHSALAHEEDEEHLQDAVSVNLLGAMFVGTHALRVMAEQGHGAVVNMISSAQMGVPALGAYSATKGGLASLTYCWAIDMKPFNVRVNCFSPSGRTRMSEQSGAVSALARQAPPAERNAPAVVYLLSDAAHGITGQVVQLRQKDLVLVARPRVTEHYATSEEWTTEAVIERFDPVLRENAEELGWAPTPASS